MSSSAERNPPIPHVTRAKITVCLEKIAKPVENFPDPTMCGYLDVFGVAAHARTCTHARNARTTARMHARARTNARTDVRTSACRHARTHARSHRHTHSCVVRLRTGLGYQR